MTMDIYDPRASGEHFVEPTGIKIAPFNEEEMFKRWTAVAQGAPSQEVYGGEQPLIRPIPKNLAYAAFSSIDHSKSSND